MLVSDYLGFEISEFEKDLIVKEFKDLFKASQIKKQAFFKLLETKVVRKYDADKARATFKKIRLGMKEDEKSYKKDIFRDKNICLRNFKVELAAINWLKQD